MGFYVAYYRVSTDRQGESGLGLDAQREAVKRFTTSGQLVAEFTEVESGKKHTNRPQLLAALAECKRKKATLVIAKLDRLARNVHFITGLMESRVEFVCCDNPHANKAMVQMLAVFGEHEREQISHRTKAALQQVRAELAAKGFRTSRAGRTFSKLGNPNAIDALQHANAARLANRPAPEIVSLMQTLQQQGKNYTQIARELNRLNIKTGRGCQWHDVTVRRALQQHQSAADEAAA
jgi:DNA invertase Pin-like site-specific DNA recombinase